jgi:hypothetical protein
MTNPNLERVRIESFHCDHAYALFRAAFARYNNARVGHYYGCSISEGELMVLRQGLLLTEAIGPAGAWEEENKYVYKPAQTPGRVHLKSLHYYHAYSLYRAALTQYYIERENPYCGTSREELHVLRQAVLLLIAALEAVGAWDGETGQFYDPFT